MMAAGTLPAPGTEYGPCTAENDGCLHRDCMATRADAAAVCPLCTEPIDYDVRYYRDPALGLVHALCYEIAAEQVRPSRGLFQILEPRYVRDNLPELAPYVVEPESENG